LFLGFRADKLLQEKSALQGSGFKASGGHDCPSEKAELIIRRDTPKKNDDELMFVFLTL
jgi:hypothetical protein